MEACTPHPTAAAIKAATLRTRSSERAPIAGTTTHTRLATPFRRSAGPASVCAAAPRPISRARGPGRPRRWGRAGKPCPRHSEGQPPAVRLPRGGYGGMRGGVAATQGGRRGGRR
eukprot:2815519-Prymnesium_polylepis.1